MPRSLRRPTRRTPVWRTGAARVMRPKLMSDRCSTIYFGAGAAALFGLDQPLPEAEQAAREADQQANHCNAMPAGNAAGSRELPALCGMPRWRRLRSRPWQRPVARLLS